MDPSPKLPLAIRIRRFIREARSRGVFHALAVYGAIAWGGIATAPDLLEFFELPAQGFAILLAALAAALPVVLFVSWNFDFSVQEADEAAAGVDPVLPEPEPTPQDGPRLLGWVVVGSAVASVALGVVALNRLLPKDDGAEVRISVRAGPGWSGGGVGASEMAALVRRPLEWLLTARVISDGGQPLASLEEGLQQAESAGATYLAMIEMVPGAAPGLRVSLHSVPLGERLFRSGGGGPAESLPEGAGRVTLELARFLGGESGVDLRVRPALLGETHSPEAVGHFVEGARLFARTDFDGAVAALNRSIQADPTFAPAYYRMAVVERWRWNHPAGLAAVDRALQQRDLSPRWRHLLEAQRLYLSRDVAGTIAAYAKVTLDHDELAEGWLGLGEALFHYGGFAGHRMADARQPFERSLESDSLISPIGHHLAELALARGDQAEALRRIGGMAEEHPVKPVMELAARLHFGPEDVRRDTWAGLDTINLRTLSLLVAHFSSDLDRRELVDSIALRLMANGRPPADRMRGAQYRLMTAKDSSEWAAALGTWRALGAQEPFDPWVVHAHQAGLDAPEAASMLEWADAHLALGRIPDFSLPLDHELRRAFHALVHEALISGDSARVDLLHAAIRGALPGHSTDPSSTVLPAALRARNALLAHDTTRALDELQRALSRTFEPYVTFYPMATFAPERRLLIRLARATGDDALAARWVGSFSNSMSFGDLLYQYWASEISGTPPGRSPQTRQEGQHER